jgi:hypothetical protein
MKIVIGMATFGGREEVREKAIESLKGQGAEIRVYDNSKEKINLTDNGKFFFLKDYSEPIIYLSCDDDILYPPTYVKDMVQAIKTHKTIVTHHGRILLGLDRNYYLGHLGFRCLGDVQCDKFIHVAGTGVTGFDTSYFNPIDIYKSNDKKMMDLVFSLEAMKEQKKITILAHNRGYLKDLRATKSTSIYYTEQNNNRQQQLANEIFSGIVNKK